MLRKRRCRDVRTSEVLLRVMGVLALAAAMAPTAAQANHIATATEMTWAYTAARPECQTEGKPGQDFWPGVTYYWDKGMRDIGVSPTFDECFYWEQLADAKYGGKDSLSPNIDSKDATFIGTHGYCDWTWGQGCSQWLASLSGKYSNPDGDCKHRTKDLYLGNNNVEYVDLNACYSNELDMIELFVDHTYRLHKWHGFYGMSNTMVGVDLDDFIDDAQDSSATMAWLNKQVRWDPWGDGYDICPTSTTRGNDNVEAQERSGSETYSWRNSWSDPRGPGRWYVYWNNCTPRHDYYD